MNDQERIKELERRVENLERIIVGLQGNDDRLKEKVDNMNEALEGVYFRKVPKDVPLV